MAFIDRTRCQSSLDGNLEEETAGAFKVASRLKTMAALCKWLYHLFGEDSFDAPAFAVIVMEVAGNNEYYNIHFRDSDLWLP